MILPGDHLDNGLDESLEQAAHLLRGLKPEAPRPGLKDDLLAAFSEHAATETAREPAVFGKPSFSSALAVAALLLISVFLFSLNSSSSNSTAQENVQVAALQRLNSDLDQLTEQLAYERALRAEQAAKNQSKAPDPLFEEASQDFPAILVGQGDPSLFRLTSARSMESLDKRRAAKRYHEILNYFPGTVAAGVAKQRLQIIDP